MAFEMAQKVLFKHCDPAGIVFYPRYFEMINDCVEAFFDHLGHPFEKLHQTGAVPTAEISTLFTAPSRHGDQLTLGLEVTRLGRSSLGLTLTARCAGETRFTASATLVYITPEGRPAPWPEALRASLEPHVKGQENGE